ncbi:hypothetical protein DLAC_05913 [Tieghemostelium lacteum]|uniref:Uncharacterized protein n=1 Tax=Tieghemostelium lacteum TaxID=361077 RepID=A0A151ZGZ7_TIELA|nr:hypothetical protein DLAC_05913 [Tieghemostelium lacteum]|eukprot:KYQ93258.1 hypothetical protein DLAC_05913 [Tieghemostelium lacteum]
MLRRCLTLNIQSTIKLNNNINIFPKCYQINSICTKTPIFSETNTDKVIKISSKEKNILNKKNRTTINNKYNSGDKLQDELKLALDLDKLKLPRCTGCGCTLQFTSPNELGYIPKSIAVKHLNSKDTTNKPNNKNNSIANNNNKEVEEEEDDNEINLSKGKEYFERFHVIKKKLIENHVCQRCHLLKNYGKITPVKIPIESFRDKLSELKNFNCVIVKVIDLMDFNGSFVHDFRSMIGNNPVILVGNKLDILPDDIHHDRIENWLRKEAKDRGLQVSHVKLLSSINRDGIKQFIVELENLRRGRDVFIVGCSNVGKSTFVNTLINEYNNKIEFKENTQNSNEEVQEEKFYTLKEIKEMEREKEKNQIMTRATTSVFPGTTLNLVSIPIWENSKLFDTPGVDNPYQIVKLLNMEELKMVIPSKRIKPSLVHMISNKTIFLGGLVRIDYEGSLAAFHVYTSSLLPIHISNTAKSDELYQRQVGKLFSPPILHSASDNIQEDPRFNKFDLTENVREFNITPENIDFIHTYVDVVISGLGWISIKSLSKNKYSPTKIKVYTPKNIDVTLRNPLIPLTTNVTILK